MINKDINDRRFIFKNGYTPGASEDSCRYCKYGCIFKGYENEPIEEKDYTWACNKPSGIFRNITDYCGYFKRYDKDE